MQKNLVRVIFSYFSETIVELITNHQKVHIGGKMKIVIALQCAASVISMCGSLAVISTFLLFRRLRAQKLMSIIAYISIGELLGNTAFLIPYRPSAGWWCNAQAFLYFTGYPISWLWTLCLTYNLYCISLKRPFLQYFRIQSIVCWGLPVLFSLTDLAFSSYSRDYGNGYSFDICTVNSDGNAFIYVAINYYGCLVFCLLVMSYLLWSLAQQAKQTPLLASHVQLAQQALELYPLSLIIFWVPQTVTSLAIIFGDLHGKSFEYALASVLLFRQLHGLVTSAIFFAKSPESRRLWWILISKGDFQDMDNDPTISSDSRPVSTEFFDQNGIIRMSDLESVHGENKDNRDNRVTSTDLFRESQGSSRPSGLFSTKATAGTSTVPPLK